MKTTEEIDWDDKIAAHDWTLKLILDLEEEPWS